MSFKDAVRTKDFVVAAELPLMPDSTRESIIADARALGASVDGLVLTDNQYGQPHMSPTTAAAILIGEGFSPVLQLSCRNRNRIALIGEILGARALGVDSLLLVRGAVLPEGYTPRPEAVRDLGVKDLIATVQMINEDEKLGSKTDFMLGTSATIHDPPPNWQPEELTSKADAGAQFVITQVCFDTGVLRRYVEHLVSRQLLRRFSIIVGMTILNSAELAIWLRENRPGAIVPPHIVERLRDADDPVEEGIRLSAEMTREIASIAGVSGVIFTLGSDLSSIPRVLAEAGVGDHGGVA